MYRSGTGRSNDIQDVSQQEGGVCVGGVVLARGGEGGEG